VKALVRAILASWFFLADVVMVGMVLALVLE